MFIGKNLCRGTAVIRKDEFNGTSRPWACDMYHIHSETGECIKWPSWAYGFKTKKALEQHITAVSSYFEILRDKTQDYVRSPLKPTDY